MSTTVRIQFAKRPSPKTLGALLANAVMDDNYEDADIIHDDED